MGTNYYLHRNVCPHCDKSDDIIHIGKSSFGWTFALHTDPDKGLASLEEWQDAFDEPGSKIRDEDWHELSSAEMRLIIERKHLSEDLKRNWGIWVSNLAKLQGYSSEADFHHRNNSMRGPDGLIRRKLDGHHCVGHGEGSWDLVAGEFS